MPYPSLSPRLRTAVLSLGVAAYAAMGSSCNLDPVHRAGVNSLGPEREDLYVPESEFHRPGEPCALCHSEKGPADSIFVLGGTIFWGPGNDPEKYPNSYARRVDSAYVRVLDSFGTQKCFVTNCNGNFFVRPEQFRDLRFPLLVSVERTEDPNNPRSPTLAIRRMGGHIGREASCATCHIQGLRDYGSPGQIRMYDDEETAAKAPITEPCPNDKPPVLRCPEDR